jgi:hypothetical protein
MTPCQTDEPRSENWGSSAKPNTSERMKIEAIVKPFKLEEVKDALEKLALRE